MEKVILLSVCLVLMVATIVVIYKFCIGKQKERDLMYNNWHMKQQRIREANMHSFLNGK